jgi:hypothetical protein
MALGSLDPPRAVIGDAEQPGLAGGDERGEGGDRRGYRRARVLDVGVQQVVALDAEALAALSRRRADGGRREALVGGRAVGEADAGESWACTDLGGDHHLVGEAPAGPPTAEQLLALAATAAVVPPRVVRCAATSRSPPEQ